LRSRRNTGGRGRGQNLEVEVEDKFNSPGLNLNRPNRTLYFTVKIYSVKHCAVVDAVSSLIMIE